MHIEGSYDFEFERELVWDVLMDIDVLGSIIPGSKGLDRNRRKQIRKQVGCESGSSQRQVRIASFELVGCQCRPRATVCWSSGKGPGRPCHR